jgi:hypothetical protein
MSRPKRARRFEPRYGVSREILECEAKYVAREVEDYLLLSLDDLKTRVEKVWKAWEQADQTLEGRFANLGDSERLALQCLIVRDMYHLMELYLTHFSSAQPHADSRATADRASVVEKMLPHSEWLFDMEP